MNNGVSSILVISQNPSFSGAIEGLLNGNVNYSVSTQGSTLAGLNGSAVQLADNNDLIVFEAHPDNPDEMASIAKLVEDSGNDTHFVAVADRDITLSEARALTSLGVDEVLPPSISKSELVAALDNAVAKPAVLAPVEDNAARGKIISVSKSRGGVGGTTLAVNLACKLAAQNRRRKKPASRVALVDFDLQFGNVGDFLDLGGSPGFSTLITEEQVPDDNYLDGILARHKSGIDVLTAPDTPLPLNAVSPGQIAAILDLLTASYDFVVVDLPQALVDWTEPIVSRTDLMIVATDTAVPTLRYARRLIDLFREEKPALEIEIVVCGEKRPLLKNEFVREGERVLQAQLDTWIPSETKLARRAIDVGVPLTLMNKRNQTTKAFASMSETVRRRLEATEARRNGETTNVS